MTGRTALRRGAAAVLLGALAYSARHFDLRTIATALASCDARWIALAITIYAAILPLWACEWHLLSPRGPRNSFRDMLGVVALTSTTLNTTPFFVGEAAGVGLLVTRIGLSGPQALAVLTMDQLMVGIAKVLVIALAMLLVAVPAWMRDSLPALAVGVGLLGAGVAVLARRPSVAVRLVHRVSARLSIKAQDLAAQLTMQTRPETSALVLLLALAKKGCEVGALIAGMHAFGISLPPSVAVLALAALSLATLVPVIPANVGAYEGALIVVYARYGVSPETALALGVVQHLCYFGALALPGYVWLFVAADTPSAAAR